MLMIYFIQAKKHIKIGYSDDPCTRLRELQTGNPHKLKLMATMPGDSQTEIGLHEVFKKYRVEGEWFKYTGHLQCCIMAFNDPKRLFEITDVKSLQQAGLQLQLRQKVNRSNKNKKCVVFRNKMKKYANKSLAVKDWSWPTS